MTHRSRSVLALLTAAVLTAPFISSAAACPSLSRSFARGASGPDVLALQIFLLDRNFLEESSMTSFFGQKTESAVQVFQTQQGIVSSGAPGTTGFGSVGAKTRARIAVVCLSKPSTNTSGSVQQRPVQTVPVIVPTPTVQSYVPTNSQPTSPQIDIGTVTVDSVKVQFYAMPPQTILFLIDPVTGNRVDAGGFSPLVSGGTGYVSFPMSGEFAGKSYKFQAQSSTTAQTVAVSQVFQVPKPAVTEQVGTFTLYDGEIPLSTFPGITRSNAEARCKAEKANNPARNTKCAFNGESILF